MKTYIGIDFSLNSPSLTFCCDGKFQFVSLFNFDGNRFLSDKYPKAVAIHRMLSDSGCVTLIPYERKKTATDYSEDQFNKIADADSLAKLIIDTISKIILDSENMDIALEGYSYGSKGNAIIDIVSFNSVLRNYLYRTFPKARIFIFSPSAIKKFAGKGNASKTEMFDFFINNKLEHDLYKFIVDNKETLNNGKDVKKPIDDLIDSYFICKYLMYRVLHDAFS